MTPITQDRLDRIVRVVSAMVRGKCCRSCLIKIVRQQARKERLPVTIGDVRIRVASLGDKPTPESLVN